MPQSQAKIIRSGRLGIYPSWEDAIAAEEVETKNQGRVQSSELEAARAIQVILGGRGEQTNPARLPCGSSLFDMILIVLSNLQAVQRGFELMLQSKQALKTPTWTPGSSPCSCKYSVSKSSPMPPSISACTSFRNLYRVRVVLSVEFEN